MIRELLKHALFDKIPLKLQCEQVNTFNYIDHPQIHNTNEILKNIYDGSI